jgi:hypothetical protein
LDKGVAYHSYINSIELNKSIFSNKFQICIIAIGKIMAFRILISFLFIMSISAMDNGESEKASRQLFTLMNKAHGYATGKTFNALLGLPEEPFDFSEQSLLPKAQSLLDQGADANYKIAFAMSVAVAEKHGLLLPTSMELAQKLKYQEIVNLFSVKKIK